MQRIAAFLFAATIAAGSAIAADVHSGASGLSAAFGNTLLSTYPDGRQAKLWLNPDGTYASEGRRHGMASGRWKIKGARLCLKQSQPFSVPFTYCSPLQSGGVGTSWRAKAPTGEPISVTLVHGRPQNP